MSADFWAGYISGAAGILIGNPLDLIKVRLQAGGSGIASLAGGATIWPGTGIETGAGVGARTARGRHPLYEKAVRASAAWATGSAAPVLGYGALNALLFVSYREAEAFLSSSGPQSALQETRVVSAAAAPTLTGTWLAGAFAGLATWIVSCPTELIKCRAQLEGMAMQAAVARNEAAAATAASASSWSVARRVWAAEGLRGFFLGGTVTALRDSIGYGFYFWSYMLATQAWRRGLAKEDELDSTASASTSAAATLLCGGLAGIVTWVSVFPLDVIKTRIQAQALRPPSAERKPLLSATPPSAERRPLLSATPASSSSAPPRLSSWQITRQAYREGGIAVFFRGLGVCSARAFVVNAAQWAVYEWIMRELAV